MKQTTTILLTLLIVLAGQTLRAEVQPVNIILHDSSMVYLIPAGKVLIIEHLIWIVDLDYLYQSISITPANEPLGLGDISLSFPNDTNYWTPLRPIRIIGGSGAEISIIAAWRHVMIVGLLVDYDDLYAAAIDSRIESPMLAGNNLHLEIALASPRPAIVRTQRASEVDGPYQSTSNRPTKTGKAGVWHLEESLEGLGKKGFFRSLARTRESE